MYLCPEMGARTGVAVLGILASLAAAPAIADGPSPVVEATTDNEFFPKTLTVPPGTTVYWENRGIAHNVKFEDGQFEQPADPSPTPWRVWRKFDVPGVYRFYCEMHGGPGGQGMSGTIVVDAKAAPRLTKLKVTPRQICNKRTSKCRTVQAAITYKLSEKARVTGGIDPVRKPADRRSRDIDVRGKKGANSLRISGPRWQPGRYKVTLGAEDGDGNESDAATAFFRVTRAR